MENFLAIPIGKQDQVRNAALMHFAKHSYNKASIRDIAQSAEISKASLFHYFGNKKALYLYLYQYSNEFIMDAITKRALAGERDFFRKMHIYQSIKISVLQRYAYLFDFIASANFENDAELAPELGALVDEYRGKGLNTVFNGADYTKFPKGVDQQMVINITLWCAEGQLSKLRKSGPIDVDRAMAEFSHYLQSLRQGFYKGPED